jgi:hypothetical protein
MRRTNVYLYNPELNVVVDGVIDKFLQLVPKGIEVVYDELYDLILFRGNNWWMMVRWLVDNPRVCLEISKMPPSEDADNYSFKLFEVNNSDFHEVAV